MKSARALVLSAFLGLFGCGGAAFTLEPSGVESGPVAAVDAGDAAASDTMNDAGAGADASTDLAIEHPWPSADAGAGDAPGEAREVADGGSDAASARDAIADAPAEASPGLCCQGIALVPAASAACYPPGAGLSETCGATGDGGQTCTTTSNAPPASCTSGAPCIETVGAQTLPGSIGPC
jgi:hypothetical protein